MVWEVIEFLAVQLRTSVGVVVAILAIVHEESAVLSGASVDLWRRLTMRQPRD